MDEQILFDLLRADLNRLGERPDDDYLKTLLRAARLDLEPVSYTHLLVKPLFY